MAEESINKSTQKDVSTANQSFSKPTKPTRRLQLLARAGDLLASAWVVGATLLSVFNFRWVELVESQVYSTFFAVRGTVVPPNNIVILAIDEQSISVPQQYYKTNPQAYSYLETLKTFPFQRAAYARVIEKLVRAGARHVAIDVVFDLPSIYGEKDDRQLQAALHRYGNKVTLAALYENFETHQGIFWQLRQPQQRFCIDSVSVGSVNFPLELDNKVHRLASEFPKLLAEKQGWSAPQKIPSFEEALLRASQVDYPPPKGDRIYFYGKAGTFETIPFWYALDPDNWNTYLQGGKVFKDKIVLIGATARLTKDYYSVPAVSNWLYPEQMSGVEIHANAIATLMEDKSIALALKSRPWRGLFVLCLVGGCALVVAHAKGSLNRFFCGTVLAITWGGISYALFAYNRLIFPTAVPMLAIATIGLSYVATQIAREIFRKRQLLVIFNKYKSSPVVQEILNQQQDFQQLLLQLDMALSGKILGGRYKILKVLGAGGFSKTYIAEDTQRPGSPLCVVKQLHPASSNLQQLAIARRLFYSEAQTLEKLGTHPQIPQLLAYFEQEEEFYLVQEYMAGRALSQELPLGQKISEIEAIAILQDLLQILTFIHQNGVIHRDIKPSNIIRRDSDGKLVLIDFGAVKEVTTQLFKTQQQTAFTIGIGTKGYAPSEQCFGRPHYNSDIYAVGMIAIRALTGIPPHELETDANGQLQWTDKTDISHEFAEIISKMVQEDFQKRYQSASEVLQALDKLILSPDKNSLSDQSSLSNTLILKDASTLITPCASVSEDSSDSNDSPS
jgi:CHASE2 domain-containing sensor protein/tRNA A-37 threonylcarbamoyl transferase component Bud32